MNEAKKIKKLKQKEADPARLARAAMALATLAGMAGLVALFAAGLVIFYNQGPQVKVIVITAVPPPATGATPDPTLPAGIPVMVPATATATATATAAGPAPAPASVTTCPPVATREAYNAAQAAAVELMPGIPTPNAPGLWTWSSITGGYVQKPILGDPIGVPPCWEAP